jgi:hypothetical protein
MVLSRGCTCLRSALPLARARSAPTQQNLYSPTEFRTHSCWDIFPQISQIHTELLLRKLPQISQNTQNFLAEIFSHRFHFLMRDSPTDFTHRSYGAFKGVHLSQVHQHNKIYILPQNSEHILAGIFSHRFHRFTQNFLAEKNSVKSVDSVGDIRTLTSVRVKSVGVFSTTNLEWILWEFFNYKLQTRECYRKLGTTLQRRGNDITGAR